MPIEVFWFHGDRSTARIAGEVKALYDEIAEYSGRVVGEHVFGKGSPDETLVVAADIPKEYSRPVDPASIDKIRTLNLSLGLR